MDESFDLTGRTGSYFYMAPEVVENKPYNEKVRHTCTQCVPLQPFQTFCEQQLPRMPAINIHSVDLWMSCLSGSEVRSVSYS